MTRGQVLGTGQVSDAGVPERGDMVDGELGAWRSLTVTEGTEPSSRLRLKRPSGTAPARIFVEQLAIQARGGRDEAVDLASAHRLQVAALANRVVVGVDDQRRVAVFGEPILDPAQDGREQGVGDVGDEHPDRM